MSLHVHKQSAIELDHINALSTEFKAHGANYQYALTISKKITQELAASAPAEIFSQSMTECCYEMERLIRILDPIIKVRENRNE
ncbi:hypothetical protein N7481_006985 [Penicillium waksmanii]|uniref:uncharacterized protein n=1 Tax=Penicillium waksmanii TaxID=69791 RepID=UPI0025483DEE|nr:uncharacterized protein N7481_006985 [Penicillium waksmanii]KAJ5979687.1 hypothetical protein N7481_006985 [Penicillium waksmanii]